MCWDELFDAMWLCEEFGSRSWTSRGLVSVVGAMRAIEGCGVRTGFFGMRAGVTQMAAVTAHFGLRVGFFVDSLHANFTKRDLAEPSCKLHNSSLKLDRQFHEELALGG